MYTPMLTPKHTPKNSTKRKILQQLNESINQNVPQNVRMISQKAYIESYSLQDKFKNLEDPLGFIRNRQLQQLAENTQKTALKVKKQIDQTCQFSKAMYKKIISSREANDFNFQNMKQEAQAMQKYEIDENEIIKSQRKLKSKDIYNNPMQILIRQLRYRQTEEKTRSSRGPNLYRHQREQVLDTGKQQVTRELSYAHVKMIDTSLFEKNCKKVQFYDILRKKEPQNQIEYSQQFQIGNNHFIDKLTDQLTFPLIDDSCQWGNKSKEMFYDFDLNLKFWKHHTKSLNLTQQSQNYHNNERQKDQDILSNFIKFNKKQINVNDIYDFAMDKINLLKLKHYFSLKKQHLIKSKQYQNQDNLEQKYNQLKKQYDYAHDLKVKLKSQRVPVKYVDSDCQTIRILQQKDFDDYFHQDLQRLFQKIDHLNKVRERALSNKHTKEKLVIAKNACQDIRQNLFKLLTMILKGEKFYPRQAANEKNYAPFFTYVDLFNIRNREEVEKNILQLIYTKIDEFQCDKVDGVSKAQLIQLYVEQREKNNRILEIIDFMN